MKAMVLAAGEGMRLLPLTGEVPKPMAPVAGTPIIGHIFELLARTGIEEAHVNVCYLADAILGHYGEETLVRGMAVRFSREEELLGTAGGVKRLADHFGDTFVVVMGDALTDVDVRKIVAFHKKKGALATIALKQVFGTSEFGVVELDREGNVLNFQEKPLPREAISNLANTGIYVFEPEALEYIPENTFFDFAKDVFPRLLAAGEKFVGYEGSFYWSDIGNLQAYRRAQRDALSGRVRVRIPGERWGEGLWVDQDARLRPGVVFEGRATIGSGTVVGPAVTLAGDVAIGGRCRVGAGASVKQSVLLPGSSVGDGASVENCILGPGYKVLPGEMIQDEVLVRGTRRQKWHLLSSDPAPPVAAIP